jgi:hypothetical protein
MNSLLEANPLNTSVSQQGTYFCGTEYTEHECDKHGGSESRAQRSTRILQQSSLVHTAVSQPHPPSQQLEGIAQSV